MKARKGRSSGASRRHTIALEAAKVMANEHISDFRIAKEKALSRLGLGSGGQLPNNQEIESALIDYRRLFLAEEQSRLLPNLYQAARQAMALFSSFSPRLVGSILSGVADRHAPIELHLFSDHSEAVVMHLIDRGMPYQARHKRYRWPEGDVELPAVGFLAGDFEILAVIFPEDGLRRSPLSPVDGRPMRRIDSRAVDRMINDYDPCGSNPHGS